MDIGIVTSHTSFKNNYGAVLQCYALCEQLKRWGISPHVINHTYSNSNMIMEMTTRESHSIAARIRYILSGNISIVQKMQYRANRNNRRKLENRFLDFCRDFIPITPSVGVSYEEILQKGFGYDGYITGSDQVWNPLIHGNKNDPCCFLQFAENGAKKIAYAPSFGIASIPEHCKESLAEYVGTFDAVSVREVSGQKILFDTTGKEFPIVLDPTLMADTEVYNPITSQMTGLPKRYILCYRFGKMKYFNDAVKKISKKLRLPVVELPLSIESYGKGTLKNYSVGPAEFIGAIKGAELVLTDSFHCTVFSILNHKPFYTFLRQSEQDKNSMNGRMKDLLESLGLQDRLIVSAEEFEKTEISLSMDFSDTDAVIAEKRKASQNYLKKALGIE